MIRRNFAFDDGTQAWLLISQVEHARISGELAGAWRDPLLDEVVEAIAHHDDGWAKWEAAPRLDAARGRPPSFMELSVAEAIRIWSDSIASARRIGPLAGAIVAGHFIGLASGSDHAADPAAAAWLESMVNERTGWLAEWHEQDPTHSREQANRAQQMLLATDLLSLWLCFAGPLSTGDEATVPNSEMATRTSMILGKYQFTTARESVGDAEIDWQGSLKPWPFAAAELRLEAPAQALPAAKYESWRKLVAAARPRRMLWQLRQTL